MTVKSSDSDPDSEGLNKIDNLLIPGSVNKQLGSGSGFRFWPDPDSMNLDRKKRYKMMSFLSVGMQYSERLVALHDAGVVLHTPGSVGGGHCGCPAVRPPLHQPPVTVLQQITRGSE